MKYQKVINLLDNTQNQPTKCKVKIWLKWMMIHVEHIKPIAKYNLKLRW